ncbi:MAG: TraR/DksA C4-type zinc finger protein [Chloroflexi bacterium]|nr:TraR/DksA C4-type zinc finger protein [Chloroflexota bacterium]
MPDALTSLTDAQVEDFRIRLDGEVNRLRTLQSTLEGGIENSATQATGDEVATPEDIAAVVTARDQFGAQAADVGLSLRRTLAALARINEGTFGRCADCGQMIALPRLEARPVAERCMACEQKREGGRRR